MNYIMKTIAQQFPGAINLLRNLAQAIELELKTGVLAHNANDGSTSAIPENSLDLNMGRLDLASQQNVGTARAANHFGRQPSSIVEESSSRMMMSVEQSRDKTSPNILNDGSLRSGGYIAAALVDHQNNNLSGGHNDGSLYH